MILIGKKIEDYFKSVDLMESLLLELVFIEQKKELKLVLDVPRDYADEQNAKIIEYDKEWVAYVFKNVSSYNRINGADTLLLNNLNNYSLKRDKRSKVIHFFKAVHTDNSCLIEIDLGDFGIVKFKFIKLNISILYGKARKDPPVWHYIDALSGKLIDYYDPFKNRPDRINF